jgi:hypothetical protein
MPICRSLLMAMLAGSLYGQLTQVDLRLQSRDVDFSAASATKPFRSGTGLPSTCGQGEMYYRLDAAGHRRQLLDYDAVRGSVRKPGVFVWERRDGDDFGGEWTGPGIYFERGRIDGGVQRDRELQRRVHGT